MQLQVLGNNVYSISDGRVIRSDYSSSYGNIVIIKSSSGMGFLYAHLREKSILNVGDNVEIGTYIGHEGATGDVTGIHLHIEMQDLTNHDWVYGAPKSYYSNPAAYMGFPNQEGISVIYYGNPIFPIKKNNTKKWIYNKCKKINIKY